MEPHATIAAWQGDTLTLYDATQGPSRAAGQIAAVFGLEPGGVRVIAEHVGGGFGAKGMPRANVVLAAMAARVIGRPVKCAVTRPADVRGDRPPGPVDPAGAAGRRPGRQARGAVPRRLRPDLHAQGVHRAVGGGHAGTCTPRRTGAPPTVWSGSTCRRPSLDARAGRVPGDVRPGIGHGRAGRGLRYRPGGIADTERARRAPRDRPAVLQPQPGGLPARGRRAVRLGRP